MVCLILTGGISSNSPAEPLLTAVNFSPKGQIINMKIFAKRKSTFIILSYLLSIICLSEVVII